MRKFYIGPSLIIARITIYIQLNKQYFNKLTQDLSVWKNISKLIPGSTPDSCMFKILSLKKTKLAIQKWSK